MCVQSLSHVQLSAIPWTVARQALRPWDSLGKNTGGGCHSLFQRIFPTLVSCIPVRFFPESPRKPPVHLRIKERYTLVIEILLTC